jgi:Dyp-type peroxidase family
MSTPSHTSHTGIEFDDIQGLLRFGYKHHTEACFLLLRVKHPAAARAWLDTAPVTSAVPTEPPPATVLQLAFTSAGLHALGVPDDVVQAFSAEFLDGMAPNPVHNSAHNSARSRRLGDIGANAPQHWQWGTAERLPHVLVLLYALPGQLARWQQQIETACAPGFDTVRRLPCSDRGSTEPFGFADGLSQPQIDWQRTRAAVDAEQTTYSNLGCLGEFVLGYPNEYGGYTDRPLVPDTPTLPLAEDRPDHADLGRNGSYLVLRQLQQDVHRFWQTLDQQAHGDPALREQLAAALVGRTRQGTPLEPSTDASDPNAFGFDADPRGTRCPLGAHIRRANPRTADLPPGPPGVLPWLQRTLGFDAPALDQDRVAASRFHRLLRRGRAYGAQATPAQALAGPASVADTGLYFISLGAHIARQFEFVQGAWLNAPHFNGLPCESDPLLGHRQPTPEDLPTDGYRMPQAGGPAQRLQGLPQFVTVRGGAYFFLPGIRALRYLASFGGAA